jgi:hypothetical protein
VIITAYQTEKVSDDHPYIWRYTARRALVIFDHPYNGGTARGYQALFASLAVAVPGPHGPAGGRPGALPVRLMVAALARWRPRQ